MKIGSIVGMHESLHIRGLDHTPSLSGSIPVNGAKNAALKVMASSILFADPVTVRNVPNIEDIERVADLLRGVGAEVAKRGKHTYTITPPKEADTHLPQEISKRLRASIVLTGPMLARHGEVHFPHPGGCVIGSRPIDLFIEGFKHMGARVKERNGMYHITAPEETGRLHGADIFLRNQSVTATETFMMAAVHADGTTTIKNAATEPEVVELAEFLNSAGARISGAGTHTITIKGVKRALRARGNAHRVIPDRIEAGSFLILGALAGKNVTVTHCEPKHLESLIETLTQAGARIEVENSKLTVSARRGKKQYQPVDIKTHEYPGFPTDLQAPMTVFLTQADGESLVFETIFEGRLNYTESLKAMGADITMMDPHRVLVRGANELRGKTMESPDLRAGLAYVIAALIAKGDSVIHNVYNIDRGYERIEERLGNIGANISRMEAVEV